MPAHPGSLPWRLASVPGPGPAARGSEDRCFSDRVNMLPSPGDHVYLHLGGSRWVLEPVVGCQPHFCAQGRPPPAWGRLKDPPGEGLQQIGGSFVQVWSFSAPPCILCAERLLG